MITLLQLHTPGSYRKMLENATRRNSLSRDYQDVKYSIVKYELVRRNFERHKKYTLFHQHTYKANQYQHWPLSMCLCLLKGNANHFIQCFHTNKNTYLGLNAFRHDRRGEKVSLYFMFLKSSEIHPRLTFLNN